MKESKIAQAMSYVDDDLISEAEAYAPKKKKRTAWVAWGALAASFALIVTVWVMPHQSEQPPDTSATPLSLFTITAHAQEGDSTAPITDQVSWASNSLAGGQGDQMSLASSSLTGEQIDFLAAYFGVDMPRFHFTIAPWENDQSLFSRYELRMSYNGHTVEGRDEHVTIFHFVDIKQDLYYYDVVGWFSEPTDLLISFIDKESGETVEAMTLHIAYSEQDGAYRLWAASIHASALYDIDRDGVQETCCLVEDTPSGFALAVYEGERLAYEYTYQTDSYYLSFVTGEDGRLKVRAIAQNLLAETHERLFDLEYRDGKVVLVEGDTVITPDVKEY